MPRRSALFSLLTAVMTWPQVSTLGTACAAARRCVLQHVASRAGSRMRSRNRPLASSTATSFIPEPRTLTFSDAMPVESIMAAPLFWSGVQPVLVHNLMLSGWNHSFRGRHFRARGETHGEHGGRITAGIVFRLRAISIRPLHASRASVDRVDSLGVLGAAQDVSTAARCVMPPLLGVFTALQFMSSVYYGIFLCTLLAVCGPAAAVEEQAEIPTRARALATAGIVAGLFDRAVCDCRMRSRARGSDRSQKNNLECSVPVPQVIGLPRRRTTSMVNGHFGWDVQSAGCFRAFSRCFLP